MKNVREWLQLKNTYAGASGSEPSPFWPSSVAPLTAASDPLSFDGAAEEDSADDAAAAADGVLLPPLVMMA